MLVYRLRHMCMPSLAPRAYLFIYLCCGFDIINPTLVNSDPQHCCTVFYLCSCSLPVRAHAAIVHPCPACCMHIQQLTSMWGLVYKFYT